MVNNDNDNKTTNIFHTTTTLTTLMSQSLEQRSTTTTTTTIEHSTTNRTVNAGGSVVSIPRLPIMSNNDDDPELHQHQQQDDYFRLPSPPASPSSQNNRNNNRNMNNNRNERRHSDYDGQIVMDDNDDDNDMMDDDNEDGYIEDDDDDDYFDNEVNRTLTSVSREQSSSILPHQSLISNYDYNSCNNNNNNSNSSNSSCNSSNNQRSSVWSQLGHLITTLFFGTKGGVLTSTNLIPKYLSKAKFIEQSPFKAHWSIRDNQTRTCVAFMSIFFLLLFVYCSLDVIYVSARFNSVSVLSIIYMCLCVVLYLILRTRWFQLVRLASLLAFTLIPYILVSLSAVYGEKLSQGSIFLMPPLSQWQRMSDSTQGTSGHESLCLSLISSQSIILFPVVFAVLSSSPLLVLSTSIFNVILVAIQPLWLRSFIPINYIDYMMSEVTVIFPIICMLIIISYMHCVDCAQIHESEKRYRNILGLTTEAIVVQDSDTGFIIDVNPSFQKCFGYSPQDCAEMSLEDFLNLKMKSRYELVERQQRAEEIQSILYQRRKSMKFSSWGECIGITKDGTEIPVEVIYKQSEYNGKEVDVYVIRDLREKREVQKQYEAAEHARTELQSRTKFFAMVSHDLKTPLNSIYLIAQKLLDKCPSKDIELVNMIIDSCQILSNIVKDVLYSTKLDSGSLTLETTRFNLKRCIEQVVSISGVTALRKGLDVALEFDVHPNAIRIPHYVYGDESKYQQIFTNLLGNAIKFTQSGSIIVRVDAVEQTFNTIKIHVVIKDTGIGIPEDKIPQLFKMFSRAHEDRMYEGTGLGLAICKNLCTLMKGDVGVRSVSGHGSEFWFSAVFTTSGNRRSSVEFKCLARKSSNTSARSYDATDHSPRSESFSRTASMIDITMGDHSSRYRRKSALNPMDIRAISMNNDILDDMNNRDLTEDDETSTYSLPSDESIHYLVADFCSRKMKKSVALIIYKNEDVRETIQNYLKGFSVSSVCIKHCDSFFSNKDKMFEQLNAALYGSSDFSTADKSNWIVRHPIALVVIDDTLFSNLDGANDAQTSRRTSIINLFDNPSINQRRHSISSNSSSGSHRTNRKYSNGILDRLHKALSKLQFLVSKHNIRCDGNAINDDAVYYCCLYYSFDMSYFTDFLQNNAKEGGLIDMCLRKPLSLTGIEKILYGMMEKYEHFHGRKPDQMQLFYRQYNEIINGPQMPFNDTDSAGNQNSFNNHVSEALSSYQFPPPPASSGQRARSNVEYSYQLPPKMDSSKRQRRSAPRYRTSDTLNVFDGTTMHLRKSSSPVILLHGAIRHEGLYTVNHRGGADDIIGNSTRVTSDTRSTTISSPEDQVSEDVTPGDSSLLTAQTKRRNDIVVSALIVDDNIINRKIVTRVVQDFGCSNSIDPRASPFISLHGLSSLQVNACSASNGAEAFALFQNAFSSKKSFDLIITDVHMGGMGGIECTQRIRQFEKERNATHPTIIIGMTGDSEANSECLAAGMDHIIEKPFKQEDLLETFEEIVRHKLKNKGKGLKAK